MYNKQAPTKREELNPTERVICSRFETIFDYDPFKDEYTFRDQALLFSTPVQPKCRTVAEADLHELKENTAKLNIPMPSYINICPIYALLPFTVLVFNNSQHAHKSLSDDMERAAATFRNPHESEIVPGAMYIFKQKHGKAYRCIILSEDGDMNIPDAERKYLVAFIDNVQIVSVKQKTLFVSDQFSIKDYPCALHCARIVGISAIRKSYVSGMNQFILNFYDAKEKRKAGMFAFIYKLDKEEKKLVIDYPSLLGTPKTTSTEIRTAVGHQIVASKDPVSLTFEQLNKKEVPEFKYLNSTDDDSDVELDLIEHDTKSVNPVASSHPTSSSMDDCPYGRASIARAKDYQLRLPPHSQKGLSSSSLLGSSYPVSNSIKNDITKQSESNRADATNISFSSFESTKSDISPQNNQNVEETSTPTVPPNSTIQENEEDEIMSPASIIRAPSRLAGSLNKVSIERPNTPLPTSSKNSEHNMSEISTYEASSISSHHLVPQSPSVPKTNYTVPVVQRPLTAPEKFRDPFGGPGSSDILNTKMLCSEKNIVPSNKFGRQISPGKDDKNENYQYSRMETKPQTLFAPVLDENQRQSSSSNMMCQIPDISSVAQGSNAPKTAPNDSVNSVAPDDIHETDKRGNHCKSVTEDPKDNKDPTAVTTLEDPDINDENFSVQSICSETFVETDQKLMEVETGADAFTESITDQFAQMSEGLKKLAINLADSVRTAAIEKNHDAFIANIHAMEIISKKVPDDIDKRFWKMKIVEARKLEAAFD